jgi:hypothetical protein
VIAAVGSSVFPDDLAAVVNPVGPCVFCTGHIDGVCRPPSPATIPKQDRAPQESVSSGLSHFQNVVSGEAVYPNDTLGTLDLARSRRMALRMPQSRLTGLTPSEIIDPLSTFFWLARHPNFGRVQLCRSIPTARLAPPTFAFVWSFALRLPLGFRASAD